MNLELDFKRIKDPDHWIRLVGIALFAIFYLYIGYIIIIVALIQFLILSLMSAKNKAIVMYVDQGISLFNDCLQYIMGSSDKKPFNIDGKTK
jgi:hypothetical protein